MRKLIFFRNAFKTLIDSLASVYQGVQKRKEESGIAGTKVMPTDGNACRER
jgi:hypothetical protein